MTSATLFNAACAMAIHSITSSPDVIFGRLTAGRAGLDADLQELIGPCLNIIPIRVKFEQSNSVQDVAQCIHQQYLDSIPHETAGLDDIVRECTSWSASAATFPIITQHVNLEDGSVAHAGDTKFDIHVWEPDTSDPFPRSLCLGAFPAGDEVRISIAANQSYVSRAFMQTIMDSLCSCIDAINRS
jgi:hypothetical protein